MRRASLELFGSQFGRVSSIKGLLRRPGQKRPCGEVLEPGRGGPLPVRIKRRA